MIRVNLPKGLRERGIFHGGGWSILRTIFSSIQTFDSFKANIVNFSTKNDNSKIVIKK